MSTKAIATGSAIPSRPLTSCSAASRRTSCSDSLRGNRGSASGLVLVPEEAFHQDLGGGRGNRRHRATDHPVEEEDAFLGKAGAEIVRQPRRLSFEALAVHRLIGLHRQPQSSTVRGERFRV
jgi:hypothetical protein